MLHAHLRPRGARRGAVAVASLLSAALLLSACGSSTDSSTTTATSATSAGSATSAAGDTSAASSPAATDTAGTSGEATTGGSESSAASSSAAGPTTGTGTFTYAVTDDPGNLDPSMTVLSAARTAAHLAYDTLIYQDTDGKFISGLADSWEVTGTSVTFTLHKGVTCSDGSTLTATDVKANIDYIEDANNKSPLLGVLLSPGLTTTANDSVGTVTVKSPTPDAFLLNNFASIFIVCKAGLADHKALAQKTIGTGPWVLSEAASNDHYTYTLNPDYAWAPGGGPMTGAGIPAQVNLRVIPNQSTAANLLLSGEVNMGAVTGSDEDRLSSAGLKALGTPAAMGETFFNQDKGRPGTDPQVRQALIAASDINQLMTVATSGKGVLSTGLVTVTPKPCQGDTVTGNLPAYNVDNAKSILDAAGWTVGSDGIRVKDGKKLSIKFIYPQAGGDSVAAAAELLAEEWKAVGVEVKPSVITATQLNDVLFSSGDWDAGWVPVGVGLPSQLVGFLSGPSPVTNFAHLNNATYTADSTKAAGTGDVTAACDLWNAGEVALIKAVDVAPMFDTVLNLYLKNATATISAGELWGASLRLTS
jgi:peptide/nickel transport system substrate-binding protein